MFFKAKDADLKAEFYGMFDEQLRNMKADGQSRSKVRRAEQELARREATGQHIYFDHYDIEDELYGEFNAMDMSQNADMVKVASARHALGEQA